MKYLNERTGNNLQRQQANRNVLSTLHVLREEQWALDELKKLVLALPDDPGVSATSERDEQDKERMKLRAEAQKKSAKANTNRRHAAGVL